MNSEKRFQRASEALIRGELNRLLHWAERGLRAPGLEKEIIQLAARGLRGAVDEDIEAGLARARADRARRGLPSIEDEILQQAARALAPTAKTELSPGPIDQDG